MTMISNDGDKLERILGRDARTAIDDDGFTARVMGALPRRVAARPAGWLAPALVLGSTALGSVLAWLFAPSGVNAAQGFVDLASRSLTPSAVATLAMSLALLVAAIVLAVDAE
jgi:hypothetical protein